MSTLFEFEYGKDNSPVDETEIRQVILYYSKQELNDFKKLIRAGIIEHYGASVTDGNVSDMLLIFLKQKYEKNNLQEADDGCSSGVIEGEVSDD